MKRGGMKRGANVRYLIRITRVLAKHDALFFLDALQVKPFVMGFAMALAPRRKRQGRKGERLAAALQELGPTFIKLGQALSTRADIIGDDVAADLALLQDRLPSFPFAQVRATIEQELHTPLETLFTEFDDVPVAAASISQVHFATTPDGEKVAVKILRPGIEHEFARDISFFYAVAELMNRFMPQFKRLRLMEVVRDFERTVRIEMDLRLEAAAASELKENFASDATLYIPTVDWARTSRRVLTLERIHGIKIDEIDALKMAGHNVDEVMAKAARVFFNQVYRDGFFHADMHPGNLFVGEDGNLVVVDFGIMGRLDQETRLFLAEMLVGFLNRDYDTVSAVHFRAGYVPEGQSQELFAQACRSIGEPIFGKRQSEISIARVLAQLFKVTEDFQMETQPQLILLQKTMVLAEGIGRKLNPNVNFWELSRPLMEDWSRRNLGLEAKAKQAWRELKKAPDRLQALGLAINTLPFSLTPLGLRLHPESLHLLAQLRPVENHSTINYWKIAALSAIISAATIVVYAALL